MKRFYTMVSHRKTDVQYQILLDAKPINTPFKNTLHVFQQGLADALVKEWSSQVDKIVPDTMPLTQIVSTKIDKVSNERAQMSAEVLKFFNTDLLCYRTDAPAELLRAQENAWDPVLKWFAQRFGSELETTQTLVALKQSQAAHDAIRVYVEALDDDRFTILQMITPLAGSIILAMAFIEGEVGGQKLFDCTHVEEAFKAEIYNEEKNYHKNDC